MRVLKPWLILLSVLPLLAGCPHSSTVKEPARTKADEMGLPFGRGSDIAYSQEVWKALAEAGLVGPGAVNSVPYTGQHPHGAVLETLSSHVTVNGHEGAVFVKKNYGGEGITNSKVANDRAAYLKAVTVMFKREAGYDADNQDWFWAKFKPTGDLHVDGKDMKLAGRVAKGNNKAGCIACHAGAGGGDYLYTNTAAQIDK